MSGINVAVVLVAGLLGGLWGWRVGTKRMYRRSVFAEDADGSGPRRRRQRMVQRYFITLLYAAMLAGGMALLLLSIKR